MAAAAYPIPLTAAQYYHVLQQQPEIVHQFYSDSTTILRIDGSSRETATGMLNNPSAKVNTPRSNQEPVPTYMVGGEMQAKGSSQFDVKENGQVENCGVPERHQQAREAENGSCAVESNDPPQNGRNDATDGLPTSAGDSVGEPPKHTYASILLVAKGQGASSLASPPSAAKNPPTSPEWDPVPELLIQSSNGYGCGAESENVSAIEDEGDIKSVYVRNLSPSVSESEVELEFGKFGKIKPNGLVIQGRKDLGVCYAFVEFEDMGGVNNAIKAGSAHIGGREVFIEERRPNSNISSRGRRGRLRGTHQTEISRDRFGSRRVGGYSGGDREYIRKRGNGLYSHQQDRSFMGRQSSRVNQDLEE